jgi:hypothetical protein
VSENSLDPATAGEGRRSIQYRQPDILKESPSRRFFQYLGQPDYFLHNFFSTKEENEI